MRRHCFASEMRVNDFKRVGTPKGRPAGQSLVEKGTNSGQEPQLAYLRGYVALHLGDTTGAIEALQDADQQDPFILLLIAQAHEREGSEAAAREYYERIMASTSHALTAAIARPIARDRVSIAR